MIGKSVNLYEIASCTVCPWVGRLGEAVVKPDEIVCCPRCGAAVKTAGPPTEIEITERARIKVGTFEADLTSAGFGTIRLDGEPIVTRKITIDLEAGKLPKIVAEIVPIASRHKRED